MSGVREKDLKRVKIYGGRFMSKGIVADMLQAERELIAADLRATAAKCPEPESTCYLLLANRIERGGYLP